VIGTVYRQPKAFRVVMERLDKVIRHDRERTLDEIRHNRALLAQIEEREQERRRGEAARAELDRKLGVQL
jgi:hypothetical protein